MQPATAARLIGPALTLLAMLVVCARAAAQEQPAGEKFPVAATVNGTPIYVGEVIGLLKQMRQVNAGTNVNDARTQAEALQQVIFRRLVVQLFELEGGYFTDEQVQERLDALAEQVKAENQTVEQYAARLGFPVETLRNDAKWDVGWNHYIERNLTEQLENYFEANRKDFDGTQVRASHILLRPERANETSEQVRQRAARLREAIESGKISFEDAAKRFSIGPSGATGGDLGFFPRYGVMFEGFAKAAFALDKGQISEPVLTPFGVHLIRVSEINPGTKQWTEALDQLRVPTAAGMFERLAEQQVEAAQIEFSGLIPYLDPKTDELVVPSPAAAK